MDTKKLNKYLPVEPLTVYRTTDGREFASKLEANREQLKDDLIANIALAVSVSTDITCNDMHVISKCLRQHYDDIFVKAFEIAGGLYE